MRHAYLLAAGAALVAGLLSVARRPGKLPPSSPPPAASSAALPVAAPAPKPAPPPNQPRARARRGGMDLTFLVTADTHAGFWDKIPIPTAPSGVGIEKVHEIAIGAMNGIAGTPYPRAIGGTVGEPRGVIVAGDLTETGQAFEWARFEVMFGLTGKDGWLHYPVYENIGNHDYGPFIREQVARRHGGSRYSWDWDDVHLVSFGEAPDEADLAWLEADLAAAGPDVGVILAFHYPLEGPYALGNWFAEGKIPEKLDRVLAGRHLLGIFNGHFHASGPYRWHGRDAYLQGSVKHSWHSFSVVHVTDGTFTVASYNYDRKAYWWWHKKPIFGAKGQEARWLSETDSLVRPAG